VLSDDIGQPLRPAILWSDGRTRRQLDDYRMLSEDLRRKLANPPATGMAGPTLLWLRDHERPQYRAAQWALQPKDWLRLRLIQEAATEPSDASGTLLYDLSTDYWEKDVLDALDLRLDFLAPIRESAEICGVLSRSASEHLGVRPNLPVVGGAADTAAAALAGGLLDPGPVQLTIGSGAQVVAPLNLLAIDSTARIHTYRAAAPERWYAMAAMQNAGLALEWVRPRRAAPVGDASALGAARRAGVGLGAWGDAQRVAAMAAPPQLVATPGPDTEAYREPYLRYRQLYLPIAAALS